MISKEEQEGATGGDVNETGKTIEKERDAAIKRKTLSLDERMSDFKEMLRERGVSGLAGTF